MFTLPDIGRVLPLPLEYAELAVEGDTYLRYALGSYSEGTRERDLDRISTEEDVEPEVPVPEVPEELTKEAAKSLKGLLLLLAFPAEVDPTLPALPVFLLLLFPVPVVDKYSGS